MKNTLLVSFILIGGIFTAQNRNIDKIYSTKELISIQSSVPENKKKEFYIQFFKANLFENIKQKFTYKKYPENLLQKFTDSIISYHDISDLNMEEVEVEVEKTMSFKEFKKSERKSRKAIRRRMRKLKKGKDEMYNLIYKRVTGNNPQEKRTMKERYSDDEIFSYYKSLENNPQEKRTMKEKYQEYVSDIKESNENNQKNRKKIVEKLNQQFASRDYFSQETQDLLLENLKENLNMEPMQLFPIPLSKDEGTGINEVIPNDILAFEMNNGYGAGVHTVMYKIIGENIIRVNIFPYDNNYNIDQNFDKKLSKYITEGYRFEDRSEYEMKKNKNGEYIILTNLFRTEDANCCPSQTIEYKTKDFKKFIPLRLLNNFENPIWIDIK